MESEGKAYYKIDELRKRLRGLNRCVFPKRVFFFRKINVEKLVQLRNTWEIQIESTELSYRAFREEQMPPSLNIILTTLFISKHYQISPPAFN